MRLQNLKVPNVKPQQLKFPELIKICNLNYVPWGLSDSSSIGLAATNSERAVVGLGAQTMGLAEVPGNYSFCESVEKGIGTQTTDAFPGGRTSGDLL